MTPTLHQSILEDHFARLPDRHVIDFDDDYGSAILSPRLATGTAFDHVLNSMCEVLAALNVCRWRHINYFTFRSLFDCLRHHVSSPVILETGSSAHGTQSSLLFATLVARTSGEFHTVDINPDTTSSLSDLLASRNLASERITVTTGDSVNFLRAYTGSRPNCVYLDSYDLSPGHFEESEQHGLAEFHAIIPKLDSTAFLLIDDTPVSQKVFNRMGWEPGPIASYYSKHGRLPGKGALILEAIRGDARFQILSHQYQLLLRYDCR